MNKITQTMRFRQSLILYAQKHGVTKAAIRYNVNRQYIYRWKNRYNGTLQSLADKSHHPNQHTDEELTLIQNMRPLKSQYRIGRVLGKALPVRSNKKCEKQFAFRISY